MCKCKSWTKYRALLYNLCRNQYSASKLVSLVRIVVIVKTFHVFIEKLLVYIKPFDFRFKCLKKKEKEKKEILTTCNETSRALNNEKII